ncbi:MAG: 1,4-dihydroxy-2-naphthoate octaprenyltransferase [Limnohabitans sp.]|nr:1,4-dihydroxy-2-naphthoate octaprenyltransferase [Limnohabitans sp.]
MKKWIQAARLRTLPLSISGILVGSFYAKAYYPETFSWIIFVLAILTTVAFQVLSNFANDYGDGIKGTDDNRIGEKRLVASGEVTSVQMKKAVVFTAVVALILAILLIYVSFGKDNFIYTLLFLFLGVASIVASIKYTVGKNAYGYSGFGDVFVFVFFGLVAILGSSFLYSKSFDVLLILPACAVGMLSAAVLNLNNMRDEDSDEIAGKNTLVVKIGGAKAKKYHYFIVITAMFLMVLFAILSNFKLEQYVFIVAFFPLINHLKTVYKCRNARDLDPQLKTLAISTFLLSLILSLALIF